MRKKSFLRTFLRTMLTLTTLTCLALVLFVVLYENGEFNEVIETTNLYDKAEILSSDSSIEEKKNEDLQNVSEPVESISLDRYAYNQLTSIQKEVYDQILNCILLHEEKVRVASRDEEDLIKANEALISDYGNLFWVSGYQYSTLSKRGEVIGIDYSPSYKMTYEERVVFEEEIDYISNEWLKDLDPNASDFEKAKFVFETLINNVEYDGDSVENQNIISVFIKRRTVCQGYADAAEYLLNKLGIECAIIRGTARNEGHAWNLIVLDGDYYYMDVTWGNGKYRNADDTTGKRIDYSYLAFTTEELLRTHKVDDGFTVPLCANIKDNYYVHEGMYMELFEPEIAGEKIRNSRENHDETLSIKFSTKEECEKAIDFLFTEGHVTDYAENIESLSYIIQENMAVLIIYW